MQGNAARTRIRAHAEREAGVLSLEAANTIFQCRTDSRVRQLRLKAGNDLGLEFVYKIATHDRSLWQLRFVSVDPARTSAHRVFVIQSEHTPDQFHVAGSCLGLGFLQERNGLMRKLPDQTMQHGLQCLTGFRIHGTEPF